MALFLYHVNADKYYIAKDSILVGRTTGHIVISEEGSMSGQHAELLVDRATNTILVKDLNSKNHTVVDRVEIDGDATAQMKLWSLLEIGSQKFILLDNRNATPEFIKQLIKDKTKTEVTRLKTQKIVTDMRNRFQAEIEKLEQMERELVEKIQKTNDLKAEAQREYEEKIQKIDEQDLMMRRQVKEVSRKLQDMKCTSH